MEMPLMIQRITGRQVVENEQSIATRDDREGEVARPRRHPRDFWKYPEYKEWERLAELQQRDAKYFAAAWTEFKRAEEQGEAEYVLKVIAHFTRLLCEAEQDGA
jgi:predicted secreted hydrolase